jgi:Chalcone isomerase-like
MKPTRLRLTGAVILFFAVTGEGALLSLPEGVKKIVVPKTEFIVPAEVEVTNSPTATPQKLALSGAGVRVKTVTFLKIKADVYLAESFVDSPLKGTREERLKQVEGAKRKAISLTMLRGLSADTIKEGFQQVLSFNGVPLENGPLKEALDQVTGDMPEKSKVTIVGTTSPTDGQVLTVEIPGKTFTVKGETIVSDFWKIWFGRPADEGLEALQTDLLGLT